jgi:hypothetical protein
MSIGLGVFFMWGSYAMTHLGKRQGGPPPTRAQRVILFILGLSLFGHGAWGWFPN